MCRSCSTSNKRNCIGLHISKDSFYEFNISCIPLLVHTLLLLFISYKCLIRTVHITLSYQVLISIKFKYLNDYFEFILFFHSVLYQSTCCVPEQRVGIVLIGFYIRTVTYHIIVLINIFSITCLFSTPGVSQILYTYRIFCCMETIFYF